MRHTSLLFVVIAGLGLPGISFAQSSGSSVPDAVSAPTSASASALIKPGDAVQITVWRRPELSGEYFVANDGSIAHPFYQDVKIGGFPADVATQRVHDFLERYETSVRVRVDPLYRVSVGGYVRQPRLYSLRPEFSILEAIDMAGGTSLEGRLHRVVLYRDGRAQQLDLSGENSGDSDILIQSGDRIVVGRSPNAFRDVIRPTITFVGSVASILHIWYRYRRYTN